MTYIALAISIISALLYFFAKRTELKPLMIMSLLSSISLILLNLISILMEYSNLLAHSSPEFKSAVLKSISDCHRNFSIAIHQTSILLFILFFILIITILKRVKGDR